MLTKDLLTLGVVTATAETPVAKIAKRLIERRISAVPVVDSAGRAIGIVSEGRAPGPGRGDSPPAHG